MIEDILNETRNIFVVSCEAGGAEILSSLVLRNPNMSYTYCLEKNAVDIFKNKLGEFKTAQLDDIKRLDPEKDLLLTSTSCMPDLERTAVLIAKENNIKSISVIDHWIFYPQRFIVDKKLWDNIPSNWHSFLPDYVVVCDKYALEIAIKDNFPKEKLILIENPYWADLKEEFKKYDIGNKQNNCLHILYICEPVMEDLEKRYGNPYLWGYTEFELIEDLTESMKKAREQGINIKVRLRLHPNEKYEKYDEYIKKCPCMEKSENKNLLTDIAWSDKVIGCESVAMAIALNLGRKVYCCMPENENKTCALPFPEIIRLKNFDNILK